MIDMLSMTFMQRALIAGLLVGFLGSYFGVFIVQRKMSFMGDGLAHAAFGGIALGLLLETEPMWIAVPFTLIISIGITLIRDKTSLEMDTSIGIFFALSVALGIIFISLRKHYTTDAFTYMFGSILSVNTSDLIISSIIVVISIVLSFKFWRKWAYATFDPELAKADKLNTKFDDYLLSALISISIVISIKLVGIVLIASFLVIPAASARLLSSTFFKMTILSVIFGLISSLVGLFLSYFLDLPSGATIILIQAIIFFIAMSLKK
ncbi:MAG: metal ABC transporter permease [Candidatus Kapabacteria bacterium]|nr:metal ABC transporter permease [Candidatus Kapabacteria bacterium]